MPKETKDKAKTKGGQRSLVPRPRKQRIKRKQKLLKSFLKKERKSTPKSTPFLYNKEQPSQSAEKASVASNAKKKKKKNRKERIKKKRTSMLLPTPPSYGKYSFCLQD